MNLLLRSLELDFEFFKIKNLTLYEKINFISKKYLLILKNIFFGFTPGITFVNIFKKKYFFEDFYGIAFLQSVFVDNSFLKNFIPNNSIIVDIGSNIGQFNFFCKFFLKSKKVYSFEPVKKTFSILKNNFLKNTYNFAISTQSQFTVYIPNTSLMAGGIDLGNSKEESSRGIFLNEIKEIENETYIDLVKIDVEGFELDAITASAKILKKTKYLLVECSVERKSIGNIDEIIKYLNETLPTFGILYIGRPYINKKISSIDAVDILFKNKSY